MYVCVCVRRCLCGGSGSGKRMKTENKKDYMSI